MDVGRGLGHEGRHALPEDSVKWLSLLLLAGCQCVQPKPCTIFLRNDGGQTARPYYAVEICEGKPARVLCDSASPLPNSDCPKKGGR